MGGNVFPEGVTRRYHADEYFALTPDIITKLCMLTNVNRCGIIPAYREKESFGDCDLLYSTYDNKPIDSRILGELFNTTNVSRNSEVTSIEYKEIQIDFIHIPNDHYDYAFRFFSYNDFGNLASKLFRYFGLKHGHMGLHLVLRDGDNKFGEILLSLDHDRALQFVGLDPATFNAGFDNLKELFDYVVTSPQYSPEWYLLENVSAAGRIRDKKRPTYQKFLEYGLSYTGPSATKVVDKSIFLEQIFDFFPEAYPAYKDVMQRLAMQKMVKEKFNGDILSTWTGLAGKELGALMKRLHDDFYFKQENIVYLTTDQIHDRVMEKFQNDKL
jgi:hypothetical protein